MSRGIVRERSGQDFDRDRTIKLRIPGAIDFAHSAGANLCGDFEGTEMRAYGESHGRSLEL
jgi:hypothetical protein